MKTCSVANVCEKYIKRANRMTLKSRYLGVGYCTPGILGKPETKSLSRKWCFTQDQGLGLRSVLRKGEVPGY